MNGDARHEPDASRRRLPSLMSRPCRLSQPAIPRVPCANSPDRQIGELLLNLYPSLDDLRQELDIKVAEQERRGASFDTKAGLLLGLGGILIGLSPDGNNLARLIGCVAAALAAGAAIWAMFPRVSAGLAPRAMRNKYLANDPETTRLKLLDTRIWLYEQDEERLHQKMQRMVAAVILLAIAVGLMLLGAITGPTT